MTENTQQEKLSFQAEVKQLLQIVVHSLYSNKEIFLRELISNASDAADKLRFESISDAGLLESDPELQIKIHYNKDKKILSISDNGIGMSRDDIVDHLGTIAKSGTKEFLSQLSGDQQKDAHLIGQFGVGFYSAFIVSDKVSVESRRAGMGATHAVRWVSAGDGEYTVETITKENRGTTIHLHLKDGEEEFLDDWRIKSIISKYSDHLNIPIFMSKKDDDGKDTGEWEQVNKATALWSLPKNKIKAEEYEEFYKHVAHDFEAPLAHTHHKVEGGHIEYTCLLYLPQKAPFDLWNRDKHYGLKLYVQRVFIMDNVEQFLPNYLRFVKGVLDTTALPLNVSREILQDHASIPKLKAALVRHTLDLLERMSTKEKDKYALFWKEFGSVLKEGPSEDFANRERVAKLFRFSSTEPGSAEDSVSFDDYIARMKDKQSKIYYITADSLAAAKSSPHLEIFNKNNIEVLLLTEKIDEWVVGNLAEYEGKPLQSVAKGDLELDDLVEEDDKTKEAEQEKEKAHQQEYDALLKQMQSILESKVAEVKLSHRLTSSPVCLVRDQNALGPQMERLLKATGQPVTESKPILELNPEHTILQKMREKMDDAQLKEWTEILFEQALIAEGGQLQDPASFVQKVNKLWVEMIK